MSEEKQLGIEIPSWILQDLLEGREDWMRHQCYSCKSHLHCNMEHIPPQHPMASCDWYKPLEITANSVQKEIK